MMALTNEGYKNSKIPLRMKLACTEHMDIEYKYFILMDIFVKTYPPPPPRML